MHCVRAYGHLADLFRALPPDAVPPRIMLHAFGGDVQVIQQFTKMPRIGDRFYFSFSTAISAKGGVAGAAKMRARMAAVPADRLLLESDQSTPLALDAGVQAALRAAMEARGWTAAQAAEATWRNYRVFFDGSLPPGE
jgi:TatD DNase family protein